MQLPLKPVLVALRLYLALLWLLHALEKFQIDWPAWLRGGTGDVIAMLETMTDTAVRPYALLIENALLPWGGAFHWLVAVAELAIAAALLAGVFTFWAALAGAAVQAGIGLGWVGLAPWFQYLLPVAMHLALAIGVRDLKPARSYQAQPDQRRGMVLLRVLCGAILLWAGRGVDGWGDIVALVAGALLVLGLLTRLGAILGFVATFAYYPGGWSDWIWNHYNVAVSLVSVGVLQAGRSLGLDQVLGKR